MRTGAVEVGQLVAVLVAAGAAASVEPGQDVVRTAEMTIHMGHERADARSHRPVRHGLVHGQPAEHVGFAQAVAVLQQKCGRGHRVWP
jgi:hypothetical protein